jgi:hypothetical protein
MQMTQLVMMLNLFAWFSLYPTISLYSRLLVTAFNSAIVKKVEIIASEVTKNEK